MIWADKLKKQNKMMMVGGQMMAHQAMMNSCPAYAVNHQMNDPLNHGIIREQKYSFPETTPHIHTEFIDKPHRNLVVDPISKLADAEWAFHESKLETGLDIIKGSKIGESAHDLDCVYLAEETYGISRKKEKTSLELMYESFCVCPDFLASTIPAKTNTLTDMLEESRLYLERRREEERQARVDRLKEEREKAEERMMEIRAERMKEERERFTRGLAEISSAIHKASATPVGSELPIATSEDYVDFPRLSSWNKPKKYDGGIWERTKKNDPSEFLVGSRDLGTHTHFGYDEHGNDFCSVFDETTRSHPFRFDPIGSSQDDAMFAASLGSALPEPEPYWKSPVAEPFRHQKEPSIHDVVGILNSANERDNMRTEMEDKFCNSLLPFNIPKRKEDFCLVPMEF